MVACEAKAMQHKDKRNGLMLALMHFSRCFLKVNLEILMAFSNSLVSICE